MNIKFAVFVLCYLGQCVALISQPRLVKVPIQEFYETMDSKNIHSITVSDDFQHIYYTQSIDAREADDGNKNNPRDPSDPNQVLLFKEINTNPEITKHIIRVSEEKHLKTAFVHLTENPFNQLFSAAAGSFEFAFMSFFVILAIRTLGVFFQNQGSAGSPFALGKVGQVVEKEELKKANISFASWAGSPEVFEECVEIVRYLKNATTFEEVGAEIPKGILLEGNPGTGKTLLAKAIASEADASFISVSASEFIELYVGLGAAKVRNVFRLARENSPAIIFIDEIDAVGRQRGAGINMGNDEREQTLNQLLAEMDGFAQNKNVIVIAATNRKDVLDSALLRPGRFDRIITVPLPDKTSRRSILGVHAKSKKVANDVNLETLAEATSGFSGAQLKNILNEGAIYAARAGNKTISQENIEQAIEKSIVGLSKTIDDRRSDTKFRVAVHEMGHAILVAKYKEIFELQKVTIQPTYSGAGGYTLFQERSNIVEAGLYTKDILKKRIQIALGGKAAEFIYFGGNHISVGAVEDLKQANSLAQRMISNYGMGKELEVFYDENMDSRGNPFLGRSLASGVQYSEKRRQTIDDEALELVKEAYTEAVRTIAENLPVIDKYVYRLLMETTLSGKDISL